AAASSSKESLRSLFLAIYIYMPRTCTGAVTKLDFSVAPPTPAILGHTRSPACIGRMFSIVSRRSSRPSCAVSIACAAAFVLLLTLVACGQPADSASVNRAENPLHGGHVRQGPPELQLQPVHGLHGRPLQAAQRLLPAEHLHHEAGRQDRPLLLLLPPARNELSCSRQRRGPRMSGASASAGRQSTKAEWAPLLAGRVPAASAAAPPAPATGSRTRLESLTAQQFAATGQAGAAIECRIGDSLVADLEVAREGRAIPISV
uniref:Ig-like domain-containing protein n=1 Tax=Macrostomum lignano TaxID=282301 RepID=A0A1I8F3F6_9PLAT